MSRHLILHIFALLAIAFTLPMIHANTFAFTYTAPDIGSTVITGFGTFSYSNNALTTVGLADLTSFFMEVDFTSPGALNPSGPTPPPINPLIVQFNYVPPSMTYDLDSFSATISGGTVTALSFETGFEAAINSSNFDEDEKAVYANSLGPGNAPLMNYSDIGKGSITNLGNGTIVVQGQIPEPSTTALIAGGAALLLGFWRRTRATRADR